MIALPIIATLKRIPTFAWYILAGVALIAAFLIWDARDDKAAVEAANNAVEAEAGKAREAAAGQRVKDALDLQAEEKELKDVIQQAPEGDLSPAAHARACELLRRQGRFPTTCGPQSGN
jgi:hypothetical protein